ncbi:MAG: hypothetical protein AAGK78_17245, partial [Planctomycetota bacterium]
LAVVILKDRVGPRRWIGVSVGLVGALAASGGAYALDRTSTVAAFDHRFFIPIPNCSPSLSRKG